MAAEVYLASSFSRSVRAGHENRRWAYIGSNPEFLRLCESKLGIENRLKAAYDLEQIATELRPDFVNWVAQLADVQPSKEEFWSITFTSRSPETSDLFQLICLTRLAIRLSQSGSPLLLIVDDPWVYRTLKIFGMRTQTDTAAQTLEFRLSLILSIRDKLAKLMFLLRGAARITVSWLLFSLQRFGDDSVALVSYAFPHALEAKNYRDPFFGDLPEELKKWGLDPIFIFPLHTPAGEFLKILNSGAGQVLARWSKFKDLLKSCCQRAHVKGPLKKIADISIEPLLDRELLQENSSNRYVLNRWQAKTWSRLARQSPERLIHIFENHPWEKALHYALGMQCLRVGYQHATIPDLLMNHMPGGNAELNFHPSRIVVNSNANQMLLSDWGWPREKLLVGGALRYSGLDFSAPERQDIRLQPTPTVYVALPGVHALCERMLQVLGRSINQRKKLRILLKFHPSFDSSRFNTSKIAGAELTERSIHQIGSQIDAVLYASSSVGLEACLIGFEVWRYVPEGMLTVNPVPRTLSNQPKACDEDTLTVLADKLTIRKSLHKASVEDLEFLSTQLNEAAWKKALSI